MVNITVRESGQCTPINAGRFSSRPGVFRESLSHNPPNYVGKIRSSIVVMARLCRYSNFAMNRKGSVPFQIHLAVDGSEFSMAAAQLVSDLPLPLHSRITILGVVPPGQSRYEANLRSVLRQAEKILDRKAAETESVLLYGHAAKQLIEYGHKHRPDLMVIGAKGEYAKDPAGRRGSAGGRACALAGAGHTDSVSWAAAGAFRNRWIT